MIHPSWPYAAFLYVLIAASWTIQSSVGFSLYIPPSSSSPPPPNNNDHQSSNNGDDEFPESVPLDTPARQTLPSHLRLVPIPGKGLGVITTIPIAAHTVVGDYRGEIMTADEKDRRYLESQHHLQTPVDKAWIQSRMDRQQTLTGTYLYGIVIPPSSSSSNVRIQDQTQISQTPQNAIYVDAEDEYCSLWTRFLNHASPPDANVNPKSIHESYDGNPRVWFISNRDIRPGEELCFDYGDDYWLEDDHPVV
mmetsp:Transcript_3807/g.5826  ORF Transcript_3807/g.5826 Transcript_3807/m.5826 type:complete len:250 (-) Transcript_3807:40-789(-)